MGVLVGLTVFVGFVVLVSLIVSVGPIVTAGTGVRVFDIGVRVPTGVNVNDGVDDKVIVQVGVADGLKPPGSIAVGVKVAPQRVGIGIIVKPVVGV